MPGPPDQAFTARGREARFPSGASHRPVAGAEATTHDRVTTELMLAGAASVEVESTHREEPGRQQSAQEVRQAAMRLVSPVEAPLHTGVRGKVNLYGDLQCPRICTETEIMKLVRRRQAQVGDQPIPGTRKRRTGLRNPPSVHGPLMPSGHRSWVAAPARSHVCEGPLHHHQRGLKTRRSV